MESSRHRQGTRRLAAREGWRGGWRATGGRLEGGSRAAPELLGGKPSEGMLGLYSGSEAGGEGPRSGVASLLVDVEVSDQPHAGGSDLPDQDVSSLESV